MKKQVIIIGGGYGGLAVMRRLSHLLDRDRYAIKVFDKSEFHCVKTRFHEIAATPSRDALIRFPLRSLARFSGAEFVQAEVSAIDFANKQLSAGGEEFNWDILVSAAGAETNYFGVEGAAGHAASVWTYENAIECGRRVEALCAGGARARLVLCGAGLAGIEVAAQLRQQYPSRKVEIIIVEKTGGVMPVSMCGDYQREYVMKYFKKKHVELRLGEAIEKVDSDGVVLGGGGVIECGLTIWCSGIKRPEIGGLESGARYVVGPRLEDQKHPGAFGLGDFTTVASKRHYANAMTAQRALFQADICAENILRFENGRQLKTARYIPKGELACLGDFDGVGVVASSPIYGAALAALKKANEARYLSQLFSGAPGYLADRITG